MALTVKNGNDRLRKGNRRRLREEVVYESFLKDIIVFFAII